MDLGFNLAQSNRDLKDPTSRQNFGDTSGLLCKNDLIPCRIGTPPESLGEKSNVKFFTVDPYFWAMSFVGLSKSAEYDIYC